MPYMPMSGEALNRRVKTAVLTKAERALLSMVDLRSLNAVNVHPFDG